MYSLANYKIPFLSSSIFALIFLANEYLILSLKIYLYRKYIYTHVHTHPLQINPRTALMLIFNFTPHLALYLNLTQGAIHCSETLK